MIKKNLRLANMEYVKEVYSSINFRSENLIVNPGRWELFPWLAGLADNFETYKIHKVSFIFKGTATCELNSITTSLGSVIMAAQYNAAASDFGSKQQMLNYSNSVNCRPHEYSQLDIDTSKLPIRQYYVDSAVNGFKKLEDPCVFSIACVGMQTDDSLIGELFVDYDIEFFTPKLYVGFGFDVTYCHYKLSGCDSTHVLGTSQTPDNGNQFPLVFDSDNQIITLPENVSQGKYLVIHHLQGDGTGLDIGGVDMVLSPELTGVLLFSDHTVQGLRQNADANNDHQFSLNPIEILAPSGTITFSQIDALPASITGGDLYLVQLNALA